MPTDPGEGAPRRRGRRRPSERPEAAPRLPPTVSRALPLRGGGPAEPMLPPVPVPAPTGPIPTGPIPTGPIPTGPIPTGPIPTGPIPTGPIPTEGPRPGSRRAARLAETGALPVHQPPAVAPPGPAPTGAIPVTGPVPTTGAIPLTGAVPVTGRVPRRTMGLPESFDDDQGPSARPGPARPEPVRGDADGSAFGAYATQPSPYEQGGRSPYGDPAPPAAEPAPARRSRRSRPPEPGDGATDAGYADDPHAAAAWDAPTGDDEPGHDAAPTGRAGRNLPVAIVVGVVLGGLVLASLLIRKEGFVAVVAAAAVVGVWELSRAFAVRDIVVPLVPLAVGSVGMVVSAFVAGEDGLLVSFGLTAFGLLLWRIIDGADSAAGDVAASIFSTAYVPFLGGFTMLMLAADDGVQRIIAFVLVTVSSDIGGYTAGVLFGKHPMAPTVSPKKSWEGFGGSVLACVLVGVTTVVLLLHGPWWAGAALGAVTALTATVGDLAESLLKRDLGIKDMGHLLPGHGGLLDRIDSILVTAPAAYVLLSLLVV